MRVNWIYFVLIPNFLLYQVAGDYVAAVYDHNVVRPDTKLIVDRPTAVHNMMRNLLTYQEQTQKAREQGADIIVFPENGITGNGFSWDSITPYLEFIPDPTESPWNPCNDPTLYKNVEVQIFLSCLARNNSIYLVANMGDIQQCNKTTDPDCPVYGHYQYNTDVAYAPDGQLLARYHKVNLFYEFNFSYPKRSIPTYFDTPFGRFGMFTCFDILFEHPAIDLVEKMNVTDIAFPTAWMDAAPLLTAIGFHSGFARGNGVNFLAANLHLPQRRFHGSGIYSKHGVVKFEYNDDPAKGTLLVGNISANERSIGQHEHNSVSITSITTDNATNSDTFTSFMFHDRFNMLEMNDDSGNLSVCSDSFCCSLSYTYATKNSSELYAFGAFRGLHRYEGKYFIEVCAVMKCKNSFFRQSCGEPVLSAFSSFKFLQISGTFSTGFVYPEVIISEQNIPGLLPDWIYQRNNLIINEKGQNTLISASMFGRAYNLD